MSNASPYEIGAIYFIRTVTMNLTGVLVEVHDKELVLVDAAWIADTDRFNVSVRTGVFREVEPFPDGKQVIVGRGALIDAVTIPVNPREVK